MTCTLSASVRVIVCIAHVHALLTCVFVFVSLFASGSWSIRNVQVCGECRPCSECVCNNDAIDSSCPPTCQDAPTGLISSKGPCFTHVFAPICRAQCTYHTRVHQRICGTYRAPSTRAPTSKPFPKTRSRSKTSGQLQASRSRECRKPWNCGWTAYIT